MSPVLPNTVVTGETTAPGVIHVGIPPDIERTSPFAPRVRPIVFPTRTIPLLKVRRSENCPVRLLYEIPPLPESEVRFILLLKVFQSSGESEPVVVEFESLRFIDVPTA